MTILIKLTLGNIFIKVKKSARAAPLSQNSWYIFQMQITPLLWRPQGPQGCLEKQNCPLNLNLVVWCTKIGSKTKKFWKSVKKPSNGLRQHIEPNQNSWQYPLINYPDSDTVIENEELIEALTNLQPVLNQSWSDLKNTLSSAATLVSFAKNSLLTSG